jgi:hypothetical protein
MTKKEIFQLIFGILLFGTAFIVYLFSAQDNKAETEDILKHAKFSTGKVLEYTPRTYGKLGNVQNVRIEFRVKDSYETGKQEGDAFFVPKDSLNIQYQYLVVYDSVEPSKFRILFNYPVKNDLDFKCYIRDSTKIIMDVKTY